MRQPPAVCAVARKASRRATGMRSKSASPSFYELTAGELILVEATVPPNTALVNRDLAYLRRHSGDTLALLALAREGDNTE